MENHLKGFRKTPHVPQVLAEFLTSAMVVPGTHKTLPIPLENTDNDPILLAPEYKPVVPRTEKVLKTH